MLAPQSLSIPTTVLIIFRPSHLTSYTNHSNFLIETPLHAVGTHGLSEAQITNNISNAYKKLIVKFTLVEFL